MHQAAQFVLHTITRQRQRNGSFFLLGSYIDTNYVSFALLKNMIIYFLYPSIQPTSSHLFADGVGGAVL